MAFLNLRVEAGEVTPNPYYEAFGHPVAKPLN
jgi:hypothetical protein